MGEKAFWESADTQYSTTYLEGTSFMNYDRACEVIPLPFAAGDLCLYHHAKVQEGLVSSPHHSKAAHESATISSCCSVCVN